MTLTTNHVIRFTVIGKPQPAGSKRAFMHPHTKRIVVTDDNKNSKPWQHLVAAAAREAYDGPLLRGPLCVTMHFAVLRPKGHFGSGKNASRVRDTAPAVPIVKPDVLKLARGTEDALTGIIWADDAQTVELALTKQYADWQGVEVSVREYAQPVWMT